ncbi:hypothetical protein [Solibacillus sp. FSL K6-1523]|uniref:hypothetical protein n=1 Tax=Solibacillus sp. FSL K6-1523 TaxID=2921471 RepID=UPI0030FC90C8
MSKIEDSTSITELRTQIRGMKELLGNKTLLTSMGITPLQKSQLSNQVKKIEMEFTSLFTLPDNFNETFKNTGWIASEFLSVEIIKKSIEIANDKGIDVGEEFLASYYTNREKVKHLCIRAKRNLGDRSSLFELATDDHFSGRYYSCIPLFLMIIDGFVNEEEATGFFAESTNLIAWDSVVGHETGLNEVSKLMSKTRRKTNVEEIKIPYRNGILHGRDLNYANSFVSSKLLAVIFSLMDWVKAKKKMKSGESKEMYTAPNSEEISSSLSKLAETREKMGQQKGEIDEWKKRDIVVGVSVSKNGKVEEYGEGTPEKCLIEVFKYINDNNFGYLADRIFYDSRQMSKAKKASEIKEQFKNISISNYEIQEIQDVAPAVTVIKVKINLEVNDKIESVDEEFRLIYSDNEQNPFVRGATGGEWKVMDNFSAQWELIQLGIK